MVSYQVRGNFEEFLVYGTKLAVIKRPDGRVTLQVHVPPGSHASCRKSACKLFWKSEPPRSADELRALAGM